MIIKIESVIQYTDKDLDGVSSFLASLTCFSLMNIPVKRMNVAVSQFEKSIEKFVDEKWKKGQLLLITDISIHSHELVEKIDQKAKEGYVVKYIDHHTSSLYIDKYDWATVVVEEDGKKTSATSLLAKWLENQYKLAFSPLWKQYIELVRQYDTWEWYDIGVIKEGVQQPNVLAKQLNDFFFLVGVGQFRDMVEEVVNQINQNETFALPSNVIQLLEIEENRIQAYMKRKEKEMVITTIDLNESVYQVGIVSAESYQSELGNYLCEQYATIDFVAMLNVGTKKVSLRSRKEDVNVESIAQFFGGGGHPKASGCTLNALAQMMLLEPFMTYSREEEVK